MKLLESILQNIGLSDVLSGVLSFFIYETLKITVLLFVAIFIFSLLRTFFGNSEFAKKIESKGKWIAYIGMALLGIVSPFCSCSTIPAFITFIAAGMPLGPAITYLITSPLIQESSFILLLSEFGIEITIIYVFVGVTTGIIAGLLASKFDIKKLIEKDLLDKRDNGEEVEVSGCGCKASEEPQKKEGSECYPSTGLFETEICCSTEVEVEPVALFNTGDCCSTDKKEMSSCCSTEKKDRKIQSRIKFAIGEAKDILRTTFKYVLIGIGVGAFIHGYAPEVFIKAILGTGNSFSPIIATLAGIPLYADDVSLIPIAKVLVDKGAGLGTSIAFLMSASVVSIPSFVLLRRALKKSAIVKLVIFLSIAIIVIGYGFNFIYPYIEIPV